MRFPRLLVGLLLGLLALMGCSAGNADTSCTPPPGKYCLRVVSEYNVPIQSTTGGVTFDVPENGTSEYKVVNPDDRMLYTTVNGIPLAGGHDWLAVPALPLGDPLAGKTHLTVTAKADGFFDTTIDQ